MPTQDLLLGFTAGYRYRYTHMHNVDIAPYRVCVSSIVLAIRTYIYIYTHGGSCSMVRRMMVIDG
jgi:hypothetical protein